MLHWFLPCHGLNPKYNAGIQRGVKYLPGVTQRAFSMILRNLMGYYTFSESRSTSRFPSRISNQAFSLRHWQVAPKKMRIVL